ncbi:MAG: ion transporter [Planctomycetota bacterium]|nr:ion transporter [Planctomycetota bacterium]
MDDRIALPPDAAPWRQRLAAVLASARFQWTIVAVILLNAVVLGMEATPLHDGPWQPWLAAIDRACLAVFVIELLLKALAYRWRMLASGWNWFDILVVAIALIPAAGPFAVLRSLRVLRVLRLLTVVPALRRVVTAFLAAIPGLGAVIALLAVFYFVAGVLATGLFGASHPEWFGHLGRSLYTLFQIMTLESWSMGIVRPIMEVHPWAWAFFIPYIIFATFTILNLFIGIIVSTMQSLSRDDQPPEATSEDTAAIIARLERDLAELKRRCGSA